MNTQNTNMNFDMDGNDVEYEQQQPNQYINEYQNYQQQADSPEYVDENQNAYYDNQAPNVSIDQHNTSADFNKI